VPYFLDGNNLIGRALATPRPTDEDRAALLRELSDRLRRTRASAVIFFDGPVEGGLKSLGPVSIRSAGARSADDAIVAEIRRSRSATEITVVTADRGLAARVQGAGAKTMAPDDFWRRFGRKGRSERPPAPERVDVDEWMEWFSDDRNRQR
jgi:predicted RNA-binding protein with PIN domain